MERYNRIEVLDVVNKIRKPIIDFFKDLQFQYDIHDYIYDNGEHEEDEDEDEEELRRKEELFQAYNDRVIDLLSKFKTKENKKYKQIICLLFHDYCLDMASNKDNKEYLDEIEIFEEVKNLIQDYSNLEEHLETQPEFYNDMLASFIDYNNNTYFDKRKILIESKELDIYLTKMYPLHLIDKLFYTIPYTKDSLANCFYADAGAGYGVVIETLRSLYHADFNNYNNLMSELIEIYYKNMLYKIKNGIPHDDLNLFKRIENNEIDNTIKVVSNNIDFLEIIISEFYRDTMKYSDDYKNKVEQLYNNSDLDIKLKIKKKQ